MGIIEDIKLLYKWVTKPYSPSKEGWRNKYFDFEYEKAKLLIEQLSRDHIPIKGRVLDVGSGIGGCSEAFTQLNSVDQVISLEILQDKNIFAKNRLKSPKNHVITADAINTPFHDYSFDFVLSFSMIEHLSNPKKFLCEMKRLLKEQGVFVLVFPPFYSVRGGHISIPFIHLLPQKLCFALASKVGLGRQIEIYKTLNKITIAQAKKFAKECGFEVIKDQNFFSPKSIVKVPVLKELLTFDYVMILTKPELKKA